MTSVTTYFQFMNKVLTVLLVFFLSCLSLLFIIYIGRKPVSSEFIRLFPPHAAGIVRVFELPTSDLYLAGVSSTQVFLGSYSNLDELYALPCLGDSIPKPSNLQRIPIVRKSNQPISVGTRIAVDSPRFHLLDAIWANVYVGEFGKSDLTSHSLLDRSFSRALPISRTTYILMAFDSVSQSNSLLKLNIDSAVNCPRFILEKQLDGQFCTQGSLSYDASTHTLLFTYRYRNRTLSLDTNLRQLYRSKTIDPVDSVQLQLDTLLTDGISKVTFKAPPLVVNNLTAASYPYYYVQSAIRAANEDVQLASDHSVIDVYDIVTGDYISSFYLPDFDGVSFSDFRVHDNMLVAIYRKRLFVFKLRH